MLLCYCVFRPEEGTFAYVRSAVRLVHTLHPSELSPSKILIHELVLSFSLLPWLCLLTQTQTRLRVYSRRLETSSLPSPYTYGARVAHLIQLLLYYITFCFVFCAVPYVGLSPLAWKVGPSGAGKIPGGARGGQADGCDLRSAESSPGLPAREAEETPHHLPRR